jgi:hypothetical protein
MAACVHCGAPADPYSPADDVAAGQRCYRCWLTDPADVKPSRIQAEHYTARAVIVFLAAVA